MCKNLLANKHCALLEQLPDGRKTQIRIMIKKEYSIAAKKSTEFILHARDIDRGDSVCHFDNNQHATWIDCPFFDEQ